MAHRQPNTPVVPAQAHCRPEGNGSDVRYKSMRVKGFIRRLDMDFRALPFVIPAKAGIGPVIQGRQTKAPGSRGCANDQRGGVEQLGPPEVVPEMVHLEQGSL